MHGATTKQGKQKKQVSTEDNDDRKKLIDISNEKPNLEKQVITLKHLNIQLGKQLKSKE